MLYFFNRKYVRCSIKIKKHRLTASTLFLIKENSSDYYLFFIMIIFLSYGYEKPFLSRTEHQEETEKRNSVENTGENLPSKRRRQFSDFVNQDLVKIRIEIKIC